MALGTWQGIFLCEFRNHGDGAGLSMVMGDFLNKISGHIEQVAVCHRVLMKHQHWKGLQA